MAFIVEMMYGQSDKLEIMGLDADGELYVEKIIPTGINDPEYRRFSCSAENWRSSLKLGAKKGWIPSGTVMEKTFNTPNQILSDYEPSSWGESDYKLFMEDDAFAFANALETAMYAIKAGQLEMEINRKSIIVESMNKESFDQINTNISEVFLTNFINFLRKGKFIFVWDD